MAAVRVTCTECDATLKLASAPPPGKKVKCPKCKALFVPPVEEEDEDAEDVDRPVKTAARQATGPKPKPKAAVKPAPEPEKKKDDDDDDSGGTYALLETDEPKPKKREKDADDDDDDEDEEEEDDPTKINYAPDESIKDLRGPATVRVNKPCNFLMMCGAVGFIGWLLVLVIAVIAVFLPVQNDPGKDEQGNRIQGHAIVPALGAVAKSVDFSEPQMSDFEKEYFKEQEAAAAAAKSNLIAMFTANMILFLVMFGLAGFGMLWGFLIMVGGVKVINLESRAWGFVSAVMVMFPFHTLGPIMLLTMVLSVIFISMLEDAELAGMFISIFVPLLCLLNIGVGVYMIVTLLHEEVVAGFEYKAD